MKNRNSAHDSRTRTNLSKHTGEKFRIPLILVLTLPNQNIYPKPCVYNCGVQIYWNIVTNEYWEVFTKKKHICPNRVNNKPVTANTTAVVGSTTATTY